MAHNREIYKGNVLLGFSLKYKYLLYFSLVQNKHIDISENQCIKANHLSPTR